MELTSENRALHRPKTPSKKNIPARSTYLLLLVIAVIFLLQTPPPMRNQQVLIQADEVFICVDTRLHTRLKEKHNGFVEK
jgi:hypothetical protein